MISSPPTRMSPRLPTDTTTQSWLPSWSFGQATTVADDADAGTGSTAGGGVATSVADDPEAGPVIGAIAGGGSLPTGSGSGASAPNPALHATRARTAATGAAAAAAMAKTPGVLSGPADATATA